MPTNALYRAVLLMFIKLLSHKPHRPSPPLSEKAVESWPLAQQALV